MREVEAKVLDIDVKAMVGKLKSLGFRKVFSGQIDTWYYGKHNGASLRVRSIGDETFITVKQVTIRAKTKDANEMEFLVDDRKVAMAALDALGYKVVIFMSKNRISYQRGDIRCEFDTYSHIPTYMEIEADSSKKVLAVAKELGIDSSKLISWPFNKIEEYYSNKN